MSEIDGLLPMPSSDVARLVGIKVRGRRHAYVDMCDSPPSLFKPYATEGPPMLHMVDVADLVKDLLCPPDMLSVSMVVVHMLDHAPACMSTSTYPDITSVTIKGTLGDRIVVDGPCIDLSGIQLGEPPDTSCDGTGGDCETAPPSGSASGGAGSVAHGGGSGTSTGKSKKFDFVVDLLENQFGAVGGQPSVVSSYLNSIDGECDVEGDVDDVDVPDPFATVSNVAAVNDALATILPEPGDGPASASDRAQVPVLPAQAPAEPVDHALAPVLPAPCDVPPPAPAGSSSAASAGAAAADGPVPDHPDPAPAVGSAQAFQLAEA